MPVAVVVQAMVPARVAGVLFTANPVTRVRDEVVIEAVYGLGEALVQGLATPDHWVLDAAGGQVKQQVLARHTSRLVGSADGLTEQPVTADEADRPALNPAELGQLCALSLDLQAKFGFPLDIEWAYEEQKLFIVQARPITTL